MASTSTPIWSSTTSTSMLRVIDLKVGKLTHSDLGQMQLYVNYYDREIAAPDENPTIGFILCADKNDAMVRYVPLRKGANIAAALDVIRSEFPSVTDFERDFPFQEILEEANKPGSPIRMKSVLLDAEQLGQKFGTVVSQSHLASRLGLQPEQVTGGTVVAGADHAPAFADPEDQKVAQLAWQAIRHLENQPLAVPSVAHLKRPRFRRRSSRRSKSNASLDRWSWTA